MSSTPFALIGVLLASGCSGAWADRPVDDPSVTPYRPSVSTPAALSAPGWVEIEAGGLRAGAHHAPSRDSVPYSVKLAFTPDWGVRINGEAWVRQVDDSGRRVSGFGDSSVIVKRRFEVDEKSAFGLEGGVIAATGRKGISGGKPSQTLNTIYSADLGNWHTDLNLAATRLGSFDPGTGRIQGLWAAALSKALDERWGLVGELSGTAQRGVTPTRQFLAAASYNVSKRATLDAGVARSLRNSEWSAFAGITFLAGRLF